MNSRLASTSSVPLPGCGVCADAVGGRKRPGELPRGLVPWWKTILRSSDEVIIEQNGLDAYFFLRL